MALLSVLVSTDVTFIRSLLTSTVTPHTRKALRLLHGRTAGSPCREWLVRGRRRMQRKGKRGREKKEHGEVRQEVHGITRMVCERGGG